MKQIILITFILLCIPISYAIYGGETWQYNFPKCDNLTVNITGNLPIDNNEYTILSNCIEETDNFYICDCNDDYNFSISFLINTINIYNIFFNYDYTKYVADKSSKKSRSNGFSIKFKENKSTILILKQYVISYFWVNIQQHKIKLVDIKNNSVKLEIRSKTIDVILYINESKIVEIDNKTLRLTLKEIRGRTAIIEFENIYISKEIIVKTPEINESKIINEDDKIIEEIIEIQNNTNITPFFEDENVSAKEVKKEIRKWLYIFWAMLLVLFIIMVLLVNKYMKIS